MIRIVFRKSTSVNYPLACDLAARADEHTVTGTEKRPVHDCTFAIGNKQAAAKLYQLVKNWLGTEVWFFDRELLLGSAHWCVLDCYLKAPSDPDKRRGYCAGFHGVDPEAAWLLPCKHLAGMHYLNKPSRHWLTNFGIFLDASHFEVNRKAITSTFTETINIFAFDACPHFDQSALWAFLDALPHVLELDEAGPIRSVGDEIHGSFLEIY